MEQLEEKILQILLDGISHATSAAVLVLDVGKRPLEDHISIRSWVRGNTYQPDRNFEPSRNLIISAIQIRRKPVLHSWNREEDQDYTGSGDDDGLDNPSSVHRNSTTNAQFTEVQGVDWAMCIPLPDKPERGWALYVTGFNSKSHFDPDLEERRRNDLKYAQIVAEVFGSLKETRFLQSRLDRLKGSLSPVVLRAMSRRNIDELLKPQESNVSVLFCDLRNSVAIHEQGADRLMSVWDRLSTILDFMTRAIIDREGVIGDFQGDAVMGFGGWPEAEDAEETVLNACLAALRIRRDFDKAQYDRDSNLAGVGCGIGISYGTAVAGALGTTDQFKVSVVGHIVNLAARLESLTKKFGVPVLLSDDAAELIKPAEKRGRLRRRRLASIKPYGLKEAVTVWELLPPEGDAADNFPQHEMLDYESGLNAFIEGAWPEASELFCRMPHDGPSRLLMDYMKERNNTRRPTIQ